MAYLVNILQVLYFVKGQIIDRLF